MQQRNCTTCGTPLQLQCPTCNQINVLNNLSPDRISGNWMQCTKKLRVHILLCLMSTLVAVLGVAYYMCLCLFMSEAEIIVPQKCYAKGNGLIKAIPGEISTIHLYIVNQTGKPSTIPVQTLSCELMSESTGEIINCTVEEITISEYDISYQPTSRGRHQLHIKVEGEHIKESPFSVAAKMPIHKLGNVLKRIDGLKAPQGMTFNQRGEMIVAEYRGHCVTILSPSGKNVLSFGKEGTGPGEFNHPTDVAVDMDGNILVTDMKNNRIQKFSSGGKFICEIGKHGKGDLEFDFPVGIGIHPINSMIYITENKNNRIQILKPDLTFFDYLPGEYNEPKDVAFDSSGNVYVADNEKHRIQVFKNGTLCQQFGQKGEKEGDLRYPSSISIDSTDLVYVLELHNYRVSLFTSKWKFLESFGSQGKGHGQFDEARGILVDKDGNIYVSDRVNDRIQRF